MALDVRNCRRCGRLFNFRGRYDCPACIIEMDERYDRVRRFLMDNPRANIDEICDGCEVDKADVLAWTREGRLVLNSDVPLLNCVKCGEPVLSGKYCPACEKSLSDALQGAKQSLQQKSVQQAPARPADSSSSFSKINK